MPGNPVGNNSGVYTYSRFTAAAKTAENIAKRPTVAAAGISFHAERNCERRRADVEAADKESAARKATYDKKADHGAYEQKERIDEPARRRF